MNRQSYEIGPSQPHELAALGEIERAAAELFRGAGVDEGLLEDSTALAEFQEAHALGLLWVARTRAGEPVGFAFVELIGGAAHLDELDVSPVHGRRGVGRALVETVCDWARAAGHTRLTLTTFRDIPWNAPFYARAGFTTLSPEELTPELAELVAEEAARGLDPAQRVVMQRRLDVD